MQVKYIMGKILEYIEQNNESGFHCYSTKKVSLDDSNHETVTSENSDTDTAPIDTSGRIAESDARQFNTVEIHNSLIINTPPLF